MKSSLFLWRHLPRLFLLLILMATVAGLLPSVAIAADSTHAHYADSTNAQVDKSLKAIVEALKLSQVQQALKEVDNLMTRYPNFQAGWVIRGDILNILAGRPVVSKSADNKDLQTMNASKENNIRGYREEVIRRIEGMQSAIPEGLIPHFVLQMHSSFEYYGVVDLSQSRLFVLQYPSHKVVAHYYISQGYNGGQKQKAGDNRTPIGIYHITTFIPREKLQDFYGDGAYPFNYPNSFDVRQGKTGSGIWIHGVPKGLYSRPPLSSNGCVVMSNTDLQSLKTFSTGTHPNGLNTVMVAEKVEWIKPEAVKATKEGLIGAIEAWRKDWQSLNTQSYLSHYAADFNSSDGMNLKAWSDHKKRVASGKSTLVVKVENISLFVYPNQQNLYLVEFDQEYTSNNFAQASRKEQYWRYNGKAWEIVLEGVLR